MEEKELWLARVIEAVVVQVVDVVVEVLLEREQLVLLFDGVVAAICCYCFRW